MADRTVAAAVARHKSHFFIEKDTNGQVIDYAAATTGYLKIAPEGEAKAALAKDYAAMLADDVMIGSALPFDELLKTCADLEAELTTTSLLSATATRIPAPSLFRDSSYEQHPIHRHDVSRRCIRDGKRLRPPLLGSAVVPAAQRQRAQLTNPPMDVDQYLEVLLRQGLVQTIKALSIYRRIL